MPTIEGNKLEQSEYGLLGKASEVITPGDDRWVGGFSHTVEDADAQIKNIAQQVGGAVNEDIVYDAGTRTPAYLEYTPFFVDARLRGSTMEPNAEGKKERVKNLLEVAQQKSIEQEVWSGVLSEGFNQSDGSTDPYHNRYFSDMDYTGFVSLSDVAVDINQGLSLLEEALGEQTVGFKPVIHMPKRIASLIGTGPNDDEGILQSPIGTTVIAGAGYTKIGSDYWMFGTTPMTIVLGEIEVFADDLSQAVNIRNNNIEYVAQRPVGVFWTSEKVFGVKVDPSIKP